MAHTQAHTDLQENTHVLEPRVYEVGYLLVPSLREEDLAAEVSNLQALIAKYKGLQIAGDEPQLIDLAYDMVKVIDNKNYKFSQGYFGWIKFDLMPSMLDKFTAELDANSNIIRSLLISTVRENTIFSKKLSFKSARRIGEEESDETSIDTDEVEELKPSVVDLELVDDKTGDDDTMES